MLLIRTFCVSIRSAFEKIIYSLRGLKLNKMSTSNNHQISLPTAIEMTARYRESLPSNFPICETFEKESIQQLLNTAGCASFRVYYGMKEDKQVHAILVAADAEGRDLLPSAVATAAETEDAVILEDGYRCPDLCPPASPLNQ